ncbi:Chaperone_protein DnaJ [Hexamita inflata]|uniref:Chaperone protein DnaJ n=1 Tax=Hexamita inflata TaxID=28002 RepID=A0AA86NAR2_9EUKA|nr:Chaperone protein DnaJ [Hexamita inflata]
MIGIVIASLQNATDFYTEAMMAMKTKKYDRAIFMFTKHIAKNPEDYTSIYLRASAYDQKSQVDNSLLDYIQVAASPKMTMAEKAKTRIFDICSAYCHLDCSKARLNMDQMQQLNEKKNRKATIMVSNNVMELIQFSTTTCARDLELNKKILLLSLNQLDFQSALTALNNLRAIMPNFKYEIQVLLWVQNINQYLQLQQYSQLYQLLQTIIQEASEQIVFVQLSKQIRPLVQLQEQAEKVTNLNQVSAQFAEMIQQFSYEQFRQINAKLVEVQNSQFGQIFAQDIKNFIHQDQEHMDVYTRSFVTAMHCYLGKHVCESDNSYALYYNSLLEINTLLEHVQKAEREIGADYEELENKLGKVIEMLRTAQQKKGTGQLSQISTIVDQIDRISDRIFRIEMSQRYPNFYSIMNITRSTPTSEIKKIYFKLARQLHPDTVDKNLPEEEKKAIARKYQQVAEAYDVLSDAEKRAQYDQGVYGMEDRQSREQKYQQRKENNRGLILSGK